MRVCRNMEADICIAKRLSVNVAIMIVLGVVLAIFFSAKDAGIIVSLVIAFGLYCWQSVIRLFKRRYGKYPWQV